jgi:hypothetical protein
MAAFHGGTRWPLRRLTDMTSTAREQQLLWEAAARAIGRGLKREFECEQQQNVPDRIQHLIAELEAKGKPKGED